MSDILQQAPRRFPHVVFVRTDKIIHPFDADIEQGLNFLRFVLHIPRI